jgi:hypothetical protein
MTNQNVKSVWPKTQKIIVSNIRRKYMNYQQKKIVEDRIGVAEKKIKGMQDELDLIYAKKGGNTTQRNKDILEVVRLRNEIYAANIVLDGLRSVLGEC